MAYCLKAIKQTNDIDLKFILQSKFFERIKKLYNLDTNNSLLILVHLDTADLMGEFEKEMNKYPDLFQFYHFHKFKQLLEEEEKKRIELKRSSTASHNAASTNSINK